MSATLAAPLAWPTRSDGRLHTGLVTGEIAARTRVLADLAAQADRSAAPTRVWAVSPRRSLPTHHVVWSEDTGTDILRHLLAVIDHRSRQMAAGSRWAGEPCALYPQILTVVEDVEATDPSPAEWALVLTRGPRLGVVVVFAAAAGTVPGLAAMVDHHQELEPVR